MEELIRMVSVMTNISETQAKTAVITVIDYLKKELSAPFDKQVENVLQGGTLAESPRERAEVPRRGLAEDCCQNETYLIDIP